VADSFPVEADKVGTNPEPPNTGVVLDVLANDTVVDRPATVNHFAIPGSGPNFGTLTKNPDQTFTYVPNPGYTGLDGFLYTVVDADGSVSSTGAGWSAQAASVRHATTRMVSSGAVVTCR
jgi:hypothetical protein